MALDPWTPVDDPASRVRKAIPGAQITSGRRSAAHNAAVGGSPTSDHMRGFAVDFKPPPGESPAAVEASLRRQGNFDQLIYEGDHVHYSDAPRGRGQVFGMKGAKAPDPWSPVSSTSPAAPAAPIKDPWAPVASAKPSAWTPVAPAAAPKKAASPTPAAPAKKPGLIDEAVSGVRNAVGDFADIPGSISRNVSATEHQFGKDFVDPQTYRSPSLLGLPPKLGADALSVGWAPVQGALESVPGRVTERASGGRIKKETAANVIGAAAPFVGEVGEAAQASRLAREAGIGETAARGAMQARRATRAAVKGKAVDYSQFTPEGPRPKGKPLAADHPARFAPETISSDPALPQTGKLKKPKVGPAASHAPPPTEEARGPVVGSEADPVERVDNALYRLGGHATADKIEAMQALRAVPKEVADPAVQEELTHAIEQRMIDPDAEIPEHLKEAEAARAPWAERQRNAINNVRRALKAKGMTDEEIEDYTPDSGYVPRRVVGKSPTLDPLDQGSKNPLAWGGKRPGLTKSTGSLKARDQIVFEGEDGTRTFEHRNPTNDEWKPGMEVRHPVTGERGFVRQATIKEIEAAKAVDSKGQPLTYHKNALVNTIDEALKAERVERNLQVLDELTQHLKEQGLAHQGEWRFKDEDGSIRVMKANQPKPEGFVELHHIPQLRGWSFSPEIAEVLKDYYPEAGEPIDNVISTINRALNASLFVTPFPHIKNVGTMGFIGRGWDWIPGHGNYGRMMKSGAQAIKEVLTLGPKYREHLREGSGMMAGDDATRNFHEAMLNMAAHGMMKAPEKIGRALGMNPVQAVKALYAVSHKILWNVNDMILFQRQLELEAKGMARRNAIKESEKWIANYRVPPQVFKSRAFRQFITDGKWINFGRYTYGKWRAIGEMVRALAKGTPEEKLDATGKIVAAGVATLFIYPMMTLMLRKATGNKNARVPMGGELAPVEAAEDFAGGEKDWASAMASFVTPAPLLEHGLEVANNRQLYSGRNIVDPQASPFGQATQAGEYGAGLFYPAELGMEAMRPGGGMQALGRFGGVSLPAHAPGAMKGSTAKRLRGMAKRREKNDPIESTVTRLMSAADQ